MTSIPRRSMQGYPRQYPVAGQLGVLPQAHLPIGTGSLPIGTSSLPIGTGSLPIGTSSLPIGTGSLPIGTGSLPIGTSSALPSTLSTGANQVATTLPTNTTTYNGAVQKLEAGMARNFGTSAPPPIVGSTTFQRPAPQSLQLPQMSDAVQKGVKVDTYEDLVEPGLHAKRVTGLNRRAMHGAGIQSALSGHEHAVDPSIAFRFEPNPRASQMANTVVQQAMRIAQAVSQEPVDVFDKDWLGPLGQDPLYTLFNTGHPAGIANGIEELSSEVRQILASQPTLSEATVPAKVYGDIHGQFRDMLLQLFHFGFPQHQGPDFIFNGDWVDRGAHQLEVVSLIFALKAVYPNRVWINRGNHEDACHNRSMGAAGFEHACIQRLGPALGPKVFAAVGQTFDYLPLGCVISKKILVVHGGIGDGQWTLNQLAVTPRPISPQGIEANSVVYNVLWSDPVPDDPGQEVFGVHDSPRNGGGASQRIFIFGKSVTDHFCALNQLDMIVRSHQALAKGFGYDVMHGGRCVRVFSARDYEGHGNDGSILSIVEGDGHLLARAQVVRSLACPKADATPLVDPTPKGPSALQNPFCM